MSNIIINKFVRRIRAKTILASIFRNMSEASIGLFSGNEDEIDAAIDWFAKNPNILSKEIKYEVMLKRFQDLMLNNQKLLDVALMNPDPFVRYHAVNIAGAKGDMDIVVNAIVDPDPNVSGVAEQWWNYHERVARKR